MRQALLAVILIAASFAGGAFVNGPGLRWAQTTLMAKLGMEGDEETPSQTPPTIAEADDTPTHSIPPLTKEPSVVLESSKTADKPEKPSKYVDSKLPKPKTPLEAASAKDSSGPATTTAALKPSDAPAALDPPVPLASPLDSEENAPDTSISLATLDDSPKPLSLSDAKIEEMPPSATTGPAPAAESSETAIPVAPNNWAEVRQTLKSLGVTRYGTEGETSGRVRFYCLIPVAGKRAVGQHFEAEGDDELQAAQAAIRRIGLWRATAEETKPPSSP